ncbi:MAG: hypothetical protein R6X35_07020 [Candidatus Krumholzibacteriia bacterium]
MSLGRVSPGEVTANVAAFGLFALGVAFVAQRGWTVTAITLAAGAAAAAALAIFGLVTRRWASMRRRGCVRGSLFVYGTARPGVTG